MYANEVLAAELNETAYTLDSTTIDLCLSIFPWASFRTTKAAVKMHTLLDLRGSIPSFVHISDGKLHDVNVLDVLVPEAGATYVMDRAYVDFERLYALHQVGAFFVTRAKKNIRCHRLYSAPTDRTLGVIADQTIALDGVRTKQHYPERLRRIRYKDPASEKTLVFLTNRSSSFPAMDGTRDETVARVLETVAADYIVKPFSPTELPARGRAQAGRARTVRHRGPDHPLRAAPGDRSRPVLLTATEYELLRVLSFNAGPVATYDLLMRQVVGRGGK